jgi:hypothetical protein
MPAMRVRGLEQRQIYATQNDLRQEIQSRSKSGNIKYSDQIRYTVTI